MGNKERVKPPSTLSQRDARKRFPVVKHGLHSEREQSVLLYHGNTRLHSIDLDGPDDVIIDGDLTLTHDITNHDGDSGAYLLVLGAVHARSIIAGGSTIAITGSVVLSNTLFGHYNHGSIEVKGDLKARAVVCSDHATSILGKIEAITVSWRGMDAMYEGEDIPRVMVQEALDDEFIDDRKMFDLLAADLCPVREGVVPSRDITAEGVAEEDRRTTVLDLRGKGLRKFPKEVFALADLETLILEDNEITNAVPKKIAELTRLRHLNLRNCSKDGKPVKLPDSIGSMQSLESLNLIYNRVKIPASIKNLASLKVLKLCIYERQKLPPELGQIPNLEELQLWATAFYPEEFPPLALCFPKLRKLEVSGFEPREIPDALGELDSLESLDPGSLENLEAFPDLGRLKALKRLRFDGYDGAPKTLLPQIMHLTWIEDLDLGRWRMDKLPEGLEAFDRLRVLDLSFNALPTLPNWLLDRPLERLDLRYNKLSEKECARIAEALPNCEVVVAG